VPSARVGQLVFAALLVAAGVAGAVYGELVAVWQPETAFVPAREMVVYGCNAVSILAGAGLLLRRTAAHAARVLLGFTTLWWLAFKGYRIVTAPDAFLSWDTAAETAVMVAAAGVLVARLAVPPHRERAIARVGRGVYALALVPLGIAHLLYVENTASLVPSYVPAPTAWAYATGVAFLAAAAAILTGIAGRVAAVLSAVQLGGFTLLVWVPIVARLGLHGAGEWNELGISAVLTAAAWVVADSYRPRVSG
jgi:uncharacterized membrane protein